MRIKDRCQGKGLVNQSRHQAHVGVSLPGPKASVSTEDGFAPHRRTSAPLCSRFEVATYRHPERCYATFIPNLEQVTNFFGQELVCSDSRLWDCKEVGNVKAILKTEPKRAWGGSATARSHLDTSSIRIEHGLTSGGDLLVHNNNPGAYSFLGKAFCSSRYILCI